MKITPENIEKLRDDEQYYGDFGRQFLSNSDIGKLLNDPTQFRQPQADNINFHKGRYFHQLILEPQKAEEWEFVDVSTRNTKAYKEFIAENNIPFALLEKEGTEIREWVSEMKGNINFYDEIMHENNKYEVPGIAEIKGRMWKGKADIITDDCIIDLKTTGDIKKFKWSAKNYNYDSQCYIYQQIFGKPLVFFVIDKTTKMLGIFKPTEEFVERGKQKVIQAVQVYNSFFSKEAEQDINEYFIQETL